MPNPASEIEKQIEAAYDFRGHVTVKFRNGETVEGFIFNREYSNPKLSEDNFIELFLKGSGERKKYSIPDVLSVKLSGKDYASGDSSHPPTAYQ